MESERPKAPDMYIKLRAHLDRMPVPFPETESGVELRLLERLFSVEEAEIALALSAVPEPVSKIYSRVGGSDLTQAELERMLLRLFRRGAIRGVPDKRAPGKYAYGKLPFVIGMFEFQVDRISSGFAADFFEYENEAFGRALMESPTKQMRTVPVHIPIESRYHIGHYDHITSVVKASPGPFGVMHCVCRQAKDALGTSCAQSEIRETCLLLEGAVQAMKEFGVCREISKKEMLLMLRRAKKAGFVLQPENTQHPSFICCCCGCCCGVLTAAKLYDKPAQFLHSNFYAAVDQAACDGCETCTKRCQMQAMIRANGVMKVDRDRCIGCGLCVPTCRRKAVQLKNKDRQYIPPKNSRTMYLKMLSERYGFWRTLRFAGRALLGRKV